MRDLFVMLYIYFYLFNLHFFEVIIFSHMFFMKKIFLFVNINC